MVDDAATSEDVDKPESVRRAPLVRSMRVTDLFGRYTYRISVRNSTAPPVILLYGDNGSGKTTILNILWNLLSPADHMSHRTALARAQFREFAVTLSSGDTIVARKLSGLVGDFEISVFHGKRQLIKQFYPVDGKGAVTSSTTRALRERILLEENLDTEMLSEAEREILLQDEDNYLTYLSKINVNPYFLADNRRIYSDNFKSDDVKRSARTRSISEFEYQRWLEAHPDESRDRSGLAIELTEALSRTSSWLRGQILSGTAQGSQGADAIYLQVLSQIVGTASTGMIDDRRESLHEVRKRLIELDARSKQFNEFGLVPYVKSEPFLSLLKMADPSRGPIIEDVLTPYLDGQRARLDSLQEIESLIRTFVETVNSFLVNKQITYSVSRGVRISTTDDGLSLSPTQLSSGERQLLLLLCHSLLSRDESALFIIDEPEISLNVKWQRKLISGLLACVQSSSVQFILATHSVEIITGHREFLAQLHSRRPRTE